MPERATYGSWQISLMATFERPSGYNAGPGAVRRAGGVPNFPETQVYVQRVLKLYRHYLNQAVFD